MKNYLIKAPKYLQQIKKIVNVSVTGSPGVQLAQFRRAAFSATLKAKVGSTLAKAAALRVNINIDGTPITSKTHTHPSHSQTSGLLTSSFFVGVPV